MDILPCPACGFLTVEECYGSYNICPVCGWEDDGVQLANPTSGGGANGESLAEAQQAALAKYPLNVGDTHGYRRGSKWRPLNEAEIEESKRTSIMKHWHASAVLSESESYWQTSSFPRESAVAIETARYCLKWRSVFHAVPSGQVR